jgi:hypothetical protein
VVRGAGAGRRLRHAGTCCRHIEVLRAGLSKIYSTNTLIYFRLKIVGLFF